MPRIATTNMPNQNIFFGSYVDQLREKARTGESLCDYFKADIDYPADAVQESPIKVHTDSLALKYKGKDESATNDLENAVALYEAFPDLNETQASDIRLWTYLTHVTFRDYVRTRWPIAGTCEQALEDPKKKEAAIRYILEHWHAAGGNNRSLRRNAIARLWWAVHLTRSPWEKDSFFNDLKEGTDPYRFTRTLFSTQDVYQQVLERGLGRDNRILITVLEFIDEHEDIKREHIRDFMKELNLALSIRNFSLLTRDEMKTAIFELGASSMK